MSYDGVSARTFGSLLILTLASRSPVAWAAEGQHPGRALFLRYCAACHGPEAKGDGVVATYLQPKPPDLTLMASRNGGAFPMDRVVKTIDGREMLRAHGEPVMPVWGQILSEELGSKGKPRPAIERRVQGTIFTIADYLRTIQAK